MESQQNGFYLKAAWLWIAGFTLFRFAYAGVFLLVPDEAYYWQWSRYLSLGYYDHPPMLAWTIKLATMLLGHRETAVRLPSVLAMAGASAYMTLLAIRYVGAACGFYTAVLTQAVLMFNVGGLLATPDSLQALAWAGAAYHLARAYDKGTWRQWLLTGFWFGFGMLSKYSMALFLPCAYLYGMLSPIHRYRLRDFRPYAGVLLGVGMLGPVIYWNAVHNWQTFRHVAYMGGANEGFSLTLRFLGDYLGSQAALLTPVVFVLVIAAWYTTARKISIRRQWFFGLLFCLSCPVFFGFMLLSLNSRVYGNWPGAGYLTAAVLVAALFSRAAAVPVTPSDGAPKTMNWGRRLWPWAIGTAYAINAIVLLHVAVPFLPIPAKMDRAAAETTGWDTLGRVVWEHQQGMPDPGRTFIFGLDYQTASEAAFYIPGQPETVVINKWNRPNAYDFWQTEGAWQGWNAVGITNSASLRKKLGQCFHQVDPPIKLRIFKAQVFAKDDLEPEKLRSFYIYRCYGFYGGLKWHPQKQSDVRS